jgi:hypothetical protein
MTEGPFAKARTQDLIVQEMGEETLVFDRRTDVAHCLSPVASLIWSLCNGTTDHPALTAAVAATGVDDAEAVVDAALLDLADKDLLQDGVSRRVAMKKMAKYGAGALAVPLVVSVMAPAAAMATSPGTQAAGTVCTNNNQCAGTTTCGAVASDGSSSSYCNSCRTTGTSLSSCNPTSGSGTGRVASTQCCSGFCNTSSDACVA